MTKKGKKTEQKKSIVTRARSRVARAKENIASFKSRRPHRSFRMTKRRDYERSFILPNYWQFTIDVTAVLWRNKKLFAGLVTVFALGIVLIGGMTSVETYNDINDTLHKTSDNIFTGVSGKLAQASIVSLTSFSNLNLTQPNETQQILGGVIGLLLWLTTVWLLREIMAGRKPFLRDGLYSAGAPIVSTAIVLVIFVIQCIPLGLMTLLYAALASYDYVNSGIGAMLFFAVCALVIAMVLYWITATAVALVIVTLPGMYPVRALRAAGDLVVGRRIRILFRLIWMIVFGAVMWLVATLPVIFLDSQLRSSFDWMKNIPLVPAITVWLSALFVTWCCAYVYCLYRKLVADETPPAK